MQCHNALIGERLECKEVLRSRAAPVSCLLHTAFSIAPHFSSTIQFGTVGSWGEGERRERRAREAAHTMFLVPYIPERQQS